MTRLKRAIRHIRRSHKKFVRLKAAAEAGLLYEAPNFLYAPRLSDKSVVIDAGCSYEADFSLLMMRRYGARAYGVDPTHKHMPALKKLEEEFPGRFVHVPAAIAATDGTTMFHESKVNESGSLLSDHVNVLNDETRMYEVECLSLGSLLKRIGHTEVDIIKLDLEGSEYALLESATFEDLRPFRQLFIEFHHHATRQYGESDTERLVHRIESFGFTSYSLDDHNYLFSTHS